MRNPDVERRRVLGATALSAAGLSALVLPSAVSAASPGTESGTTVSTGAVAATFDPNPSALVRAIAVQNVDLLVVGGDFTAVGGTVRNRIARISSTSGAVDSFNPNSNAQVVTVAVQSDGKVLAGGLFTTMQGTTRNRIARMNSDGTLDSFDPNANGNVLLIVVQTDGKILVGGDFTTIGGQSRNRLARLNADGTLDIAFDPNLNGTVIWVAPQSDGKILVGGSFSTVGATPTNRNRIARLNADGTLDSSFDAQVVGGLVAGIAVQSDGKIIFGGQLTSVRGEPRANLARVNVDGTLDTSLANPEVTGGDVNRVVVQADGAIVLAGNFTSVRTQTRNYIARLTSTGELDTGFNPNANSGIVALVLQSNGQILIGGAFTQVGGFDRNYLARLT